MKFFDIDPTAERIVVFFHWPVLPVRLDDNPIPIREVPTSGDKSDATGHYMFIVDVPPDVFRVAVMCDDGLHFGTKPPPFVLGSANV